MKSFFCKNKEDCSKVRNNGACANLLQKLDRLAVITGTNFLAFFCYYLKKISLLDPDQHIECGSLSRRENECGSMWIRIYRL